MPKDHRTTRTRSEENAKRELVRRFGEILQQALKPVWEKNTERVFHVATIFPGLKQFFSDRLDNKFVSGLKTRLSFNGNTITVHYEEIPLPVPDFAIPDFDPNNIGRHFKKADLNKEQTEYVKALPEFTGHPVDRVGTITPFPFKVENHDGYILSVHFVHSAIWAYIAETDDHYRARMDNLVPLMEEVLEELQQGSVV